MAYRRYTEEDLIRQIQKCAEELGRTPTITEFDKNPNTASITAIVKRFGSWNKGLKRAKLELNKTGYIEEDDFISQIQKLAKKLGHTPTITEFNKAPETASSSPIYSRFGSYKNFVKAAGLEKVRRRPKQNISS